jgi:hypothetical protein
MGGTVAEIHQFQSPLSGFKSGGLRMNYDEYGSHERALERQENDAGYSEDDKKREAGRVLVYREAKTLLGSPNFFFQFLRAVRRTGLVGEQRNALALYLISS